MLLKDILLAASDEGNVKTVRKTVSRLTEGSVQGDKQKRYTRVTGWGVRNTYTTKSKEKVILTFRFSRHPGAKSTTGDWVGTRITRRTSWQSLIGSTRYMSFSTRLTDYYGSDYGHYYTYWVTEVQTEE